MAGMRRARTDGYTHVLQVDADGQHDLTAAAGFLDAAQKKPEALICGYPVYDASAPLARKKGREVSNLWVKINGLSGAVKDSLCGFRVYPLSTMVKLFDARMGLRMDFDVEVLVRLLWLDTPVINRPVGVTYPADGISHFHAFADNVRISCVHTRLFFGMLVRLPELLRRKNV